MTTSINPDSLCTCGSKLQVKNCCFKILDTTPRGLKTNYSNPKCYAMELCDCSKTISKEHYFSKSVMNLWGKEGILEAPFIVGKCKSLKVESLSAKILCERHNNALSSLDDLAKKFFEFALLKTEHKHLIIRGADLERWMLKVMCGYIATGYAQTKSGNLMPAKPPPLAALNTLFGNLELPKSWGLAIPEAHGIPLPHVIKLSVLADDNNVVIGCEVTLHYIRLLFFLINIKERQKNIKKITHRPSCFAFKVNGVYREVHFGWPEGAFVNINFDFNSSMPTD